MSMRFDEFTRDEVHFLRDVVNLYVSGAERGEWGNDPDGIEIGKRLVVEMHRSMKQRSETTR